MTLMAALLLTVDAYYMFVRRQDAPAAGAASPLPELPRLKAGKPSRGGLDVLGPPSRVAYAGAREPSGVAFDAAGGRLFVVGDEGRLVELDAAGRTVRSDAVAGNLEDVALHTPSGNLVLLAEKKGELVLFDPRAHAELRRWRLDEAALLGREPAGRDQGFEGLAFREDAALAGGGVFYLVHQRAPAMIVAIAFDTELAAGRLPAGVVNARWPLEDRGDLTAATYAASLDRLLVIADGKDRLLVLRPDGGVEAEVVLPGLQQEGLSFDAAGTLWVADDRGGLLRFPGALASIGSALHAGGGSAGAAAPGSG
jgi:uncharacterized protein YjiK